MDYIYYHKFENYNFPEENTRKYLQFWRSKVLFDRSRNNSLKEYFVNHKNSVH